MEGKVQKMDHHNPGIKCIVNSCYYYAQGDYCNAQKIEVHPRNASNSSETDCATFTSNKNSMT